MEHSGRSALPLPHHPIRPLVERSTALEGALSPVAAFCSYLYGVLFGEPHSGNTTGYFSLIMIAQSNDLWEFSVWCSYNRNRSKGNGKAAVYTHEVGMVVLTKATLVGRSVHLFFQR